MNLSIGKWTLNPASGEVTNGSSTRQLTPKSTALLCALAARPGELISKEELFRVVWAGTVVSDSALTSCIRELRDVLGDDAKQPSYIETHYRRGYRCVAPVARALAGAQMSGEAPALFGREPELAVLQSAMARVRGGERQVVFISGDPGIGKSTLAEAFIESLPAPEVAVSRGQCIEHHGPAEAYLPVLEALDRLCRSVAGGLVKQALGQHAPGWLVQMPGVLSTTEMRGVAQRAGAATPQRLLRELTDAIEQLAARGPLVLLFEDLHWSDNATLNWLTHVARRRESAQLLILATYRRVEALMRGHPLVSVHAELSSQGRAQELSVGPLDSGAMTKLMAGKFGDSEAMRAVAHRVHARTEGHPLFALNLIGELVSRGMLQPADAGGWQFTAGIEAVDSLLPRDVRHVIEHRVRRLSQDEQRLLQFASVVGEQFSAASVAAGADSPVREIEHSLQVLASSDAFIRAMASADEADRRRSARFMFHHALYREVLYEQMPVANRSEAHRRIGEHLEQLFGARADDIATELAVHFEQGWSSERAIHWRRRAARNAVRRGAPREAIAHLNQARKLLPGLPPGERAAKEVEVCIALGGQLMAALGWAAPEVERAYSQAQRLAEQLPQRQGLFPALWGLWLYRSGQGELDQAQSLCDALLSIGGGQADASVRLQAHHAAWATALARGELTACCEQASRGEALYVPDQHHCLSDEYGGHDAGVCARCFHSLALALRDERDAAREQISSAIALAHTLGHPFSSAFAWYFSSSLHQILDDVEAAAASAVTTLRLAREQGFALIEAWASCIAAWAQAKSTKSTAAIVTIEDNIRLAHESGTDLFQSYLHGLLADACLCVGRADAARAAIERAISTARRNGEKFFLARLLCLGAEISDRDTARERLTEALALARAQGARLFEAQAGARLATLVPRSGST
jgi:DNA-binding winged helix-turn-helix (wHTH) protein